MNNYGSRPNYGPLWAISFLLTVIGVGSAVVFGASRADKAGAIEAQVSGPVNVPQASITTPNTTMPPPATTSTTIPEKGVPSPTPYDNHPPVSTVPAPPTTELPSKTWEEMGFGGITPLNISQVGPGMSVCRVYVGNGGNTQDLIVHEVIDFVPMTPGAALPSYVDSSFRVLAEATSDYTGTLEAHLDLLYADDMGLTGNRQDQVRTFAGSCDSPVSADSLLPGTL